MGDRCFVTEKLKIENRFIAVPKAWKMADEMRRKLGEMEELEENIISGKPWAEAMLNRALGTTQKAILHWCNFIIKIGESDLNVEENVSIFERQVERAYEELILDIETVHVKYVDKILQTLEQIQKVCKDLRLEIPSFEFEGVPLGDLHRMLLKRYSEYEAQAKDRRTDLEQLHKRLEETCKAMGITPNFIPESPLPTDECLDKLRERVDKLESEKMDREEKFFTLKAEIADIVKELGVKPTLDFERALLALDDNQVMITDAEMKQLDEFHDRILTQKEKIKEQISFLRVKVDELWNRLEIYIGERDAFRRTHTGISMDTLEALELEVKRCEELKRANIKRFIDKQRQELAELWDKCHCSDRDRSDFPFFDSDCYTEDLFELHEREIDRWKCHYEQNEDLYRALEEHKTLWIRRLEMETNTETGLNRYKNRGGQLLAEEKMRNMLAKKIPKLEENLVKLAESFRIRQGGEFLTHGKTVQEYMDDLHEDYDREVKNKLSAKKLQREQQQSVVGRSRNNLFATPSMGSNLNLATPRSAVTASNNKRKVLATPSNSSKKPRVASTTQSAKLTAPSTGKIPTMKLNTSKDRRAARKVRRQLRTSLKQTAKQNKENAAGDAGVPDPNEDQENNTASTSYMDFEKDVTTRNLCRSTAAFVLQESNNQKQNILQPFPPVSPIKLADLNTFMTPKKVTSRALDRINRFK